MMSAPAPYPLVQSSAPAIDDHEITTRTPSICVDYLSHNWTDEDVWSSWKAMTKRKNEIANGVRLENASWRTWAKQRGKLKTISPETLNWLKDSDVTWLYGPLHEHAEPVPPPKQATASERLDLEDSHRMKSILKHRTISEMLTTPGLNAASPAVESPPQIGSRAGSAEGSDSESDSRSSGKLRPAMHLTKSETALSKLPSRRHGGSPPGSERLFRNLAVGDKDDGLSHAEERRHISFNQRVDQCIAVDTEDDADDGDEDEYSDGMYESAGGRRDDEEGSSSDEEVLTMKSSPRTANAWPTMASSRQSSPGFEHQTIAKLAPTMLKTSDTYPAPSPQVVDPTGFTAHLNGTDPGPQTGQPHLSAQPQVFNYDQQDDDLTQTRYSQWDADDDFNGDFDYFNGPDVHDGYQADHGQKPHEAAEHGTRQTDQPPKGILKRRTQPSAEQSQLDANEPHGTHFSPPSSPEMPSSPNAQANKERGRTSQRIGTSASYERLQEATRGASTSSTRARSTSSSDTGHDDATGEGASSSSSPPLGSAGKGSQSGDRRESFRGRAGEGSRAMKGGAAAYVGEADSDGRASLDFNSPGYPASPLLDDKDGDTESNDEAKLYGRKRDSTRWADSRGSRRSNLSHQSDEDNASRLSVDLDNLPSNAVSPPSSAPGGPTPLNTPTFALAKSRSGGKRSSVQQKSAGQVSSAGVGGSSSSNEDYENREPESPTMPRRTSATGALVAPSHADKQSGVRVPLAHDYVEEDEGGIVGRAVEIVNTARDLIGALLGTGGDRGRSWREAS